MKKLIKKYGIINNQIIRTHHPTATTDPRCLYHANHSSASFWKNIKKQQKTPKNTPKPQQVRKKNLNHPLPFLPPPPLNVFWDIFTRCEKIWMNWCLLLLRPMNIHVDLSQQNTENSSLPSIRSPYNIPDTLIRKYKTVML